MLIEQLGLVGAGHMPGVGNHDQAGPRDLRRHVVGGTQERLVVRSDQHERGNIDRRQRIDHPPVPLGEHAAGRQRQAVRRPLRRVRRPGPVTQRCQAVPLQPAGGGDGPVVPPLPGLVAAEARTRVAQHQSRYSVRVGQPERQRQVPAERQPAEHGPLRPGRVEHGGHVVHAGRLGVVGRVGRTVTAAVTAQVPGDDWPGRGERPDVGRPHLRRRTVAVREQQRKPVVVAVPAEYLVADADAAAVQVGHRAAPLS